MCLPIRLCIASFETIDSLSQSSDILSLTVQLAPNECALLVRDDTGFVLGRAEVALNDVPSHVRWEEVLGKRHGVTSLGNRRRRLKVVPIEAIRRGAV